LHKIAKFIPVALISAVLIGVWAWWVNLSPSVKPQDIELKGVIRPVSALKDVPKPQINAPWAVEIELVKNTDKPLNGGGYFHFVYPYVQGFANASWDFNGDAADHYGVGNDSRTQAMIVSTLKGLGIQAAPRDLQGSGFFYKGSGNRAAVRVYLSPADPNVKEPQKGTAYLFYTHYEKKWGKNLSWTKAVRLDIEK
jgi:hypothetical protein